MLKGICLNNKKIIFSNNKFIKNFFELNFIFRIYINLILLLILYPTFFSKKPIKIRKIILFSQITLTINGTGNLYILTSITTSGQTYDDELPNEIIVNGNSQKDKENRKIAYNLTKKENIVILKWNKSLTNCGHMFKDLTNIIKADLSKFDSSKVTNMHSMFYGCSNLISIDLSNLNTSKVQNLRSMFNNCFSLISLDLSSFDTSSVTSIYHMLMGCKSLIYVNLLSFNSKIFTDTTDIFLNTSKNLIYCINESSSLIKKEAESLNTSNDCSNICFQNNITIDLENKKCVYYQINNSYDENHIKESNATEYFNNTIKINNNKTFDKDNMILEIREEMLNGKKELLLNNITNEDLIVIMENIIYTITTPENQRKNKNKNVSTIDLGECENRLKDHYNISDNETLYILKIDYFEKGLLIPLVEYEVYYKNKILDLNYCKDIKININLPVLINEDEEFKYNSLSDYYNDICFTYTTEKGTDINLLDRKKEFEDKNLSLCESNCEYNGYDNNTKKASCECEIKIKLPLISEIVINKDKLYKKFYDVKNYINLNVMKCWKVLFTKKGLIRNYGSYLILGLIFLYFILLFLFLITGYNKIYEKIIIIKNMNKNLNQSKKKKILTTKNCYKKKRKKNKKIIRKYKTQNPPLKNYKLRKIKKAKKSLNILQTNDNITKIDSSKRNLKNRNIINSQITFNISIINKKNKKKRKRIKKKIINNNKNNLKFNDYEINTLDYKSALLFDKRSYCEYYLSLIRIKHLIIFCFFINNDYNSKITKIILFFFLFILYLTVNALFFDDSTMHEIYIKNGEFNFIYQIPKIIYSTMICSVINTIVSALSLTERNILKFKRIEMNIEKKFLNLIKCIKIKFILFFIVSFLFLIFFWYYISCFCAIYINTQLHLLKDSIISFGLTMIYPFGLYLLPGIFRKPSLKEKNKDCLYKISKIMQII